MSGPVVSQADREAAAKCHEKSCYEIVRIQGVQCRNGYADGDYLVQAFAHHRHQSTAPLIAALEQAREVIQRLDAMWLEDWEPPHPDKAKQEPRIITEQCLDVWRDARAALAAIAAAGGNV
jgi:hypothetical protein